LVATIQRLLHAIRERDKAAVHMILSIEPELVHVAAEDGATPVMTAIYHGAGSALAMLVARGAELDIHAAAAVGNLGRVRELLAGDPDAIGSFSYDGWTPLHLAAFFGHTPTVEELLTQGADVHARSRNALANTPLHTAIAGRSGLPALDLLFAHGANPNALAAGGLTPLHLAAARGDSSLVEALLLQGASRGAQMENFSTPAELAARQGHTALAARLAAPSAAEDPITAGV
jgi:uncharacterized protein